MVLGVSGLNGHCVARRVVMEYMFVAEYVTIPNLQLAELRVLERPLKRNIAECVIAVS